MTKQNNIMKLPLLECIKRSFAYVWNDRKLFMKVLPILLAFIVLEFILSLQYSCEPGTANCPYSWTMSVVALAFILMNITVIISYCRKIVLQDKESITAWKFGKTIVFYIVATLLYSLAVIVPLTLFTILIFLTGIGNTGTMLLIYVFMFVWLIVMAPVLMWFPSIAVEDYKLLSLKKLFRLTKGNHVRLFLGLIGVSLPLFLLTVVILLLLGGIWGMDTIRDSISLWVLSMFIQFINTCLKGSYYAHAYQFFKYVEKKEQD